MPENDTHISHEELRDIKSRYNKAKGLLENIESLDSRFQAAAKKLDDHKSEIKNISEQAQTLLSGIEGTKGASDTYLGEIKKGLEKTQADIQLIEDGLRKFENIKGKIESKDGEIEVLTSTANSLKVDIEKAKETAQKQLAKIDEILGQIQENIANMQKAYQDFLVIQGKIQDKTTGLEAILTQVNSLQKSAKGIFEEIKSFRDESQKYLQEVKENKEHTDSFRVAAGEKLKEIEGDRDQVAKIVSLITDTGFANSFHARKKELSKSSDIWLGVFFVGIAGLIGMLVYFFGGKAEIPGPGVVFYRLTLTSPLLFLITFAGARYTSDRNMLEKYAFKAAVAEVVRSHTKFLIEIEDDADGENTEFARRAIHKIYSEPYGGGIEIASIKKIKKLYNLLMKDDTSSNASIKDIVNSTKELKDLIPDEAMLKDILSLLLKTRS